MKTLADLGIAFVALEHIGFLVLEMLLWQKPIGMKIFGNSSAKAADTSTLAKNMGLYNGFLAAGLIWGLLITNTQDAVPLQSFFLICVTIAGIYGALTVKKSILFVQALPALLTLVLVWL